MNKIYIHIMLMKVQMSQYKITKLFPKTIDVFFLLLVDHVERRITFESAKNKRLFLTSLQTIICDAACQKQALRGN